MGVDLKNLAVQVGRWHEANFEPEPDFGVLVICEEAGELARAVIKSRQDIRGGPEHWNGEKAKEAADVIISTVAFCYENGIDIDRAVKDRWAVVRQRVSASAEEQARHG